MGAISTNSNSENFSCMPSCCMITKAKNKVQPQAKMQPEPYEGHPDNQERDPVPLNDTLERRQIEPSLEYLENVESNL